MRIAFLVLAHHRPHQLRRLLDRLPAESPKLLHFDARAAEGDWQQVMRISGEVPNLTLVNRHRCWWGSFGIVAGTIELIRALNASGAAYDYAMLLSGADYPLRPLGELAAFLSQAPGREHIESFPIDEPNRWSGHGRTSGEARYMHYHLWFRSRWLQLMRRSRKAMPWRLHGGSQWWCLTRDCIGHIDAFIAKHPGYARYFRHTLIPDEAFFQTIVSNSPYAGNVSGTDLTFAIWDRPEPPYPAFISKDDVPVALASGKFFARKMDLDRYPEAYDAIDAALSERAGEAGDLAPARDVAS